MQVTIRLGGYSSPWRFAGSAEVERWLAAQPWRREGGIRKLAIGRPELERQFCEAMRSAVYGRSAGRSNVQLHALECDSPGQFVAAVWARLRIASHVSEYERLLELARRLEEEPSVFLVSCGKSVPGEIVDAAEGLVDCVDKLGSDVRPTFVFLLTSVLGVRGVPDDFTVGWPIGCELTEVGTLTNESWSSYLHQRLAWEAAGDLYRAALLDATYGISGLAIGDDDAFEAMLNRAALDSYSDIPVRTRCEIEKRLSSPRQDGWVSESVWRPWDELRQSGLAWLTPGTQAPGPTPWFARALLLRGVQTSVRSLLRSSVVCAPLARQILSCCFDLEAQERVRCAGDLPQECDAHAETQDSYRRFKENDQRSEAGFYPKECPAKPDDVWYFASWGEVIEHARPTTRASRHRVRHDLRILRNALSHGHYVSWRMLSRLRSIRREFGLDSSGE